MTKSANLGRTPGQFYKPLIIIVILLVSTGCASFRDRMADWWPFDQSEVGTEPASVETLSAMEKAVQWLQNGEEERARQLLQRELERNPNHRIANHLMQQIVADPQEMLGDRYQEYQVKSGDSLSQLAADHLGDPLSFYILARYNAIDPPRLLSVGQTLRLPKRDQAPEDMQPIAVESIEESDPEVIELPAQHLQAENLLVTGRPDQAIDLLTDPALAPLPEPSVELLGENFHRSIEQDLNNQAIDQAASTLETARRFAREYDVKWSWQTEAEARLAAERALSRAEQALVDEQPQQALEHYAQALEQQPEHARAKERRQQLVDSLLSEHHEAALILYRNQRLSEAIERWNQALAVDPDYEPAQIYLARARELQRRLKALEEQP